MQMGRLADVVVAVCIPAVVSLVLAACGASGQTAPTSGGASATLTVQAELLKTVDASHVKVGDEIIARTDTSLELAGAKFPTGSTLLGHITEAEPSKLALVFDHIAVKKNAPVPATFSLRAVMMPHSPPQSAGEQMSPRAEGSGGTGVDQALQTPRGRGDMLRSPEAAAKDSAVTVFQGPRPVETGNGGVIGLSGVRLAVSSDPKVGATFQADKDQKLKLEKGLLVMFVVSK